MKPLLTLLASSAVVAATLAAPAAAAPTTIATLHGDSAVRAYGGVQAWSDYDATDKQWRVMVRRDGQTSAPAAIPPAKDPIEVDVGAGSDGVPVLAYVRCADACRIVVSRLDGGTPQTVPGSAGASHPTIWGRQVAWVRGRATVMTSTWAGHGRKVLPGAPRRKCYRPFDGKPQRCEHPQSASVDALELFGRQLALVDTFGLRQAVGSGSSEVRTESIKGGPQRLVAIVHSGESGQTWVGPSWAKGKLFFYKSCFGDPSGCVGRAGGAFGFDPARGTYVHANGSTVLSGFAMDDDGLRAYETVGPSYDLACGDADARPCLLRLTDPLAFQPSRPLAPRR
jgi:hypothetical protein